MSLPRPSAEILFSSLRIGNLHSSTAAAVRLREARGVFLLLEIGELGVVDAFEALADELGLTARRHIGRDGIRHVLSWASRGVDPFE